MKSSCRLGAACALLLPAYSDANAYFLQLTGQSLSLNDSGSVIRTSISETDGTTSLAFDTGTILGSPTAGGSARSAASANLATGELKIFAEASGVNQTAGASAEFRDVLTFDLPVGVTSSQLTVNLSIDGTVQGRLNSGTLPQNLYINCNCSDPAGSGSDSLSLHDFTSTALLSATITIEEGFGYGLQALLLGATAGGNALIDLSNTGTVSLVLEEGVTFSSESGVFLSAVPIPPALWLFGSGLLGLIGISRRKKAA